MTYDLETRSCAGGCGRIFRCLPASPTRYARSDCAVVCRVAAAPPVPRPVKRRGRPAGSKSRPKAAEPAPSSAEAAAAEEARPASDGLPEAPLVEAAPAAAELEPAAPELPAPPAPGGIDLGAYRGGAALTLDLEVLLATRLLIQASSGGGKSFLLRKLLEETHGKVQQIVFDMEGEFRSLRESFDYQLAGEGGDFAADPGEASGLVRTTLEGGRSLLVDLFDLSPALRIDFVGEFLESLMNLPRDLWRPVLVVVDEAHVFMPDKVKKLASAQPMIDLCTRGRKRGFCAVLATQRVSKLHKDGAAECLNKMVGRTMLDIDLRRSADELGLRRAEAAFLRDLEPGEFYAMGPAFGRRPELARVSAVRTAHAAAVSPRPAPQPAAAAPPSPPAAPPAPVLRLAPPADADEEAEKERLWLECIEQAKACVKAVDTHRERLAELALKCCDIVLGGGGHWSGHAGLRTVRRFAAEVGVKYKTLWTWIGTYRTIIEHLPRGDYQEGDFRFACRVYKKLGAAADHEAIVEEFRRQKQGAATVYKLGSIIQWAKSHRKFIETQDLSAYPREDLEALLQITDETAAALRAFLRGPGNMTVAKRAEG